MGTKYSVLIQKQHSRYRNYFVLILLMLSKYIFINKIIIYIYMIISFHLMMMIFSTWSCLHKFGINTCHQGAELFLSIKKKIELISYAFHKIKTLVLYLTIGRLTWMEASNAPATIVSMKPLKMQCSSYMYYVPNNATEVMIPTNDII